MFIICQKKGLGKGYYIVMIALRTSYYRFKIALMVNAIECFHSGAYMLYFCPLLYYPS